ncbi:MAG TPA: response regulator [Thermoanaerobaculia bacterium]|nr:response regulator [Thermoanaerobaculia bacterium]
MDWKLAFFTSSAAAVYRERTGKLQRAFKSSSAAQANGLARPVILVVDDDKIVHVVAKRVLAEFGGTVLHATDGQAAFELAEQTLPDLVITDALLPKLDGRELSLLLKTNDATRHCKVAVITALYKGIRYRSEAAQRYLVDAYAEKPVTATTLRKIATELLPDHASFVVAEPAGETTAAGALQ